MDRYYLAHPAKSEKEIRKWEKYFEKKYDVDLINPFYEGSPTEKKLMKKLKKTKILPELTKEECILLVENDLDLIRESKGVIAIVNGQTSYGTIMEIFFAYTRDKPVYIICTNGYENHPWLKCCSTKIFRSYPEFEYYYQRVLQSNKKEVIK